jgi:hypothetical protein
LQKQIGFFPIIFSTRRKRPKKYICLKLPQSYCSQYSGRYDSAGAAATMRTDTCEAYGLSAGFGARHGLAWLALAMCEMHWLCFVSKEL